MKIKSKNLKYNEITYSSTNLIRRVFVKIQSINNNQDISYKAYFKPNAEFKDLWSSSIITEEVKNGLSLLKTLNNHELEIVKSGRAFRDSENVEKMEIIDFYKIFNNFTKKALTIHKGMKVNNNPLLTVLEGLLYKNEEVNNFYIKDEETDLFEKHTKADF